MDRRAHARAVATPRCRRHMLRATSASSAGGCCSAPSAGAPSRGCASFSVADGLGRSMHECNNLPLPLLSLMSAPCRPRAAQPHPLAKSFSLGDEDGGEASRRRSAEGEGTSGSAGQGADAREVRAGGGRGQGRGWCVRVCAPCATRAPWVPHHTLHPHACHTHPHKRATLRVRACRVYHW